MPRTLSLILLLALLLSLPAVVASAQHVSGEPEWGVPLTFTFDGPASAEAADPNPFRDVRVDIVFTHEESARTHRVPGYFAADGSAGESGGERGSFWRAHFLPAADGTWTYRTSVRVGADAALSDDPAYGEAGAGDGISGTFTVRRSGNGSSGFLGKGVLRHPENERYLRFDDGTYFLKGGADSPENFLAYAGFDNTYSLKPEGTAQEGEANTSALHRYEPHLQDWKAGDATWRGGRGKEIIGALNYLASQGMNSVYMLTMNVEGDGDDVWPWIDARTRDRYDVSKLDQWNLVFDHMDRLGLLLHLVLTETENEALFERHAEEPTEFADERKLYYRELVARFGHHPALVWNLGEENGWDDRHKESTGESGAANTDAQRRAFASYLRELDPHDHPIVVHTYPGDHEAVYGPLLGFSVIDGPSLQVGDPRQSHAATLKWVNESSGSGHSWFVCVDEIGPAHTGVTVDGPEGNQDAVRRHVLWGNLMAGGAGVEWYFGYNSPHNDLNAEDWRSRDTMWDYTRHALTFFRDHLPYWEMNPDDARASSSEAYVLARPGHLYAVYLPSGASTDVDVDEGTYRIRWYNPREGGVLKPGTVERIDGPGWHEIGRPGSDDGEDWVALLSREE